MIARGPRVRWVAAGIGPAAAVAVRILLQIRQPAPVPPAPGALRPIGAKDRLLILAPHEADKALATGGLSGASSSLCRGGAMRHPDAVFVESRGTRGSVACSSTGRELCTIFRPGIFATG